MSPNYDKMKVKCISYDTKGLTFGKEYNVIKRGSNPDSKHLWYKDWFLLINDDNKEMWYDRCPMGIIELLPLTGETIQYIGESTSGLTHGKYYQTLEGKGDEYFYFIDDNDKFVGISKINYFGGSPNFIEITKNRDFKLNNLNIFL